MHPDLSSPSAAEARATVTNGRALVASEGNSHRSAPTKTRRDDLAFCLALLPSESIAGVHQDAASSTEESVATRKKSPGMSV